MYLKIKCLLSFTLFIYSFSCAFSRYIEDSPTDYSHPVEEIQHAICQIATEDIQASANASITRQLKGVCTSKEMNSRLNQLEKTILSELSLIKQALHIENQPESQIKAKTLENETPAYNEDNYDYLNVIESVEVDKQTNPQINTYRILEKIENSAPTTATKHKSTTTAQNLKTENPNQNATKDVPVSYKRDFEAAKNNITIQNTELGKSFLYFWKIYDVGELLTFPDTHVTSPTFYLSGHQLQVKVYPQHLGAHYVAVELTSNKNFVLKHRFVILNQNDVQNDASSQILGMNAAIFRIASQKLFDEGFITDDSLLIKVIVALHL